MQNRYYPRLFEKGKIGNVTIKNRIVRNSMGTYLGNPDGTVTDRQIKAYAQAADGGVGLLFMDNAVPVPMTSCGLRADKDEFIAGLTLLAETVKEHGAVPGMQLAHPGRDAAFVGSADVIGASAITFEPWYEMGYKMPRALTIEEIHDLVERFGDAALRCKKAGFEVLEIHGAAGCIPTNFLSPHDNKRTDIYGGSLHNRMRLLLEIVRNIKKKCGPDFPIGVKLSTEDWEPEGIRIEETVEVAKALEKEGVSHLNIMGGTHATACMEFLLPNAFNAEHTKMIKDAVNIPVFIGHNIFTPEEGEKMLEEGNGDFVALGRSQLADPAWAKKARCGKAGDIKPCINCMIGCIDKGMLDPPAPRYDGNKFYPDKYMPPEEEAICWCETSLRVPLNEAGYRKKTETGANALNLRLRDLVNPPAPNKPEATHGKRVFCVGDRVMQTKNLGEVNNGDVGYITDIFRDVDGTTIWGLLLGFKLAGVKAVHSNL